MSATLTIADLIATATTNETHKLDRCIDWQAETTMEWADGPRERSTGRMTGALDVKGITFEVSIPLADFPAISTNDIDSAVDEKADAIASAAVQMIDHIGDVVSVEASADGYAVIGIDATRQNVVITFDLDIDAVFIR